jgi:hypothetical protein
MTWCAMLRCMMPVHDSHDTWCQWLTHSPVATMHSTATCYYYVQLDHVAVKHQGKCGLAMWRTSWCTRQLAMNDCLSDTIYGRCIADRKQLKLCNWLAEGLLPLVVKLYNYVRFILYIILFLFIQPFTYTIWADNSSIYNNDNNNYNDDNEM